VNLYDEFSVIKAEYTLKNSGESTALKLQYPKLDTVIKKTITRGGKSEAQIETIKGDYDDFRVTINNKPTNYLFSDNDTVSTLLPYKLGDIKINSNNSYREVIDSFEHFYNFYTVDLTLEKKETVVVKIEYKTPNYRNEIVSKKYFEHDLVIDPQLIYAEFDSPDLRTSSSERIFYYPFRTSYYNDSMDIKKMIVTLVSNVIDQDYLSILPVNYRNRTNRYYYTYRNFKPNEYHTLLIKQVQNYSDSTILNSVFDINKNRSGNGLDKYFNFDQENNYLILEFKEEYRDAFRIDRLSVLPFYEDEISNIPQKISVLFSDSNDFTKPSVYQKRLTNSQIKLLRPTNKPVHIKIGKVVSHNFIKVIFEDVKNSESEFRIRDIQLTGAQK